MPRCRRYRFRAAFAALAILALVGGVALYWLFLRGDTGLAPGGPGVPGSVPWIPLTPSTGPVLGRFLFWAGFNANAYNWFDALDVRVNTSFTTAAPLAGLKNATVQVRALRNWGPLC